MPGPVFDFHTFSSSTELAYTLAEYVAAELDQGVTDNEKASLVVSGGSTPKPFFERLSRQDIDWPRVVITLADERWVDITDKQSNENLVRSHLLQHNARKANFVGLKTPEPTPSQGEKITEAALKKIPRPFDLVILGMGNDGHTASLFPGSKRLAEAVKMNTKKDCIAVPPEKTRLSRMSMTLRALLDSHKIILHITGQEKRRTLDRALEQGAPSEMPVRYILNQQKTPVHIYWAP